MAEFLSQDEIDALLDIADEDGGLEEIPEDSVPTSKDKSYAIYDFKKPNRISADQMKAFNALHDKMLRATISEVSAMLRKIVDVKLYSIEQMTYGEFILSIPQITSLNTLSIKINRYFLFRAAAKMLDNFQDFLKKRDTVGKIQVPFATKSKPA